MVYPTDLGVGAPQQRNGVGVELLEVAEARLDDGEQPLTPAQSACVGRLGKGRL